jgi:hypothetical protein
MYRLGVPRGDHRYRCFSASWLHLQVLLLPWFFSSRSLTLRQKPCPQMSCRLTEFLHRVLWELLYSALTTHWKSCASFQEWEKKCNFYKIRELGMMTKLWSKGEFSAEKFSLQKKNPEILDKEDRIRNEPSCKTLRVCVRVCVCVLMCVWWNRNLCSIKEV